MTMTNNILVCEAQCAVVIPHFLIYLYRDLCLTCFSVSLCGHSVDVISDNRISDEPGPGVS